VGSLEGRIDKLEGRMPDMLRERDDEEKLRRQRAITRMILDELASLEASGEEGTLLEQAVRRVVEDQYSDLTQESRQYIADGWIENIHGWTRLDWMVNAGREGPPRA
jgi:hypothetical protein